jgi:hypothetical protein
MKSSKSDKFVSLLKSYRQQTERVTFNDEKRLATVGNDECGELCGCGACYLCAQCICGAA